MLDSLQQSMQVSTNIRSPRHKSKYFVDLGKFLASIEKQEFVGSEVRILSDTEIEGYTRVRNGWNFSKAYTVYFYAKFDTHAESLGTWKNGSAGRCKISK